MGRQAIGPQEINRASVLMDWSKILSDAGIPESPGRDQAQERAAAVTAARYERDGHKRAKGSNTRKVKKAARMDYSKQL